MNNTAGYVLSAIILAFLGMVAVYLAGAFIAGSLLHSTWSVGPRFFVACLSLLWSYKVYCDLEQTLVEEE